MSIIYFILVLFVIVLVHEWGHYKTAKLFGVRVDEFGFGYPPKLATLFKRKETVFTLNALPFGGFVKIYGEDAVEGAHDINRALFKKPKWQQALVLAAGVFMNVVLAWVIFLVLFLTNSPVVGSFVDKKYISNERVRITDVLPEGSGFDAGLQKGDVIQTIALFDEKPVAVTDPKMFTDIIQQTKDTPFELTVLRQNVSVSTLVIAREAEGGKAYRVGLGLASESDIKVPFGRAFLYSFTATGTILGGIFSGLYALIHGALTGAGGSVEVSGPVGIVKTIGEASRYGIEYLLSLTALISLNLAVLNILPIPALDGGRLLFLLIEKIKGKPINIKTATIIHATSFIILVGLMILVTIFDVFKLFR